MAQASDAPVHHLTPQQQAVHDAKMEIEGKALVDAALDKTHPHGFRDQLAKITDPTDPAARQDALAAAKTYELKREAEAASNPNLPKVQFYEAAGSLGQVVVLEQGKPRVAYDANGQDEKSGKEKALDGAKKFLHIKQ